MSSQTHPQKVQVAFFTTFSSILALSTNDLTVRTGRNGERSAEGTSSETAPNAPRHETSGLNLFPGHLLALRDLAGELSRRGVVALLVLNAGYFRPHYFSPVLVNLEAAARLPLPSPWTWAFP